MAVWPEDQRAGEQVRTARFTFRGGWSSTTTIPEALGYTFLHLADSGDGLAVSYEQPGSYQQREGEPWQSFASDPGVEALDASGFGQRMALLYYGPNLLSRIVSASPAVADLVP